MEFDRYVSLRGTWVGSLQRGIPNYHGKWPLTHVSGFFCFPLSRPSLLFGEIKLLFPALELGPQQNLDLFAWFVKNKETGPQKARNIEKGELSLGKCSPHSKNPLFLLLLFFGKTDRVSMVNTDPFFSRGSTNHTKKKASGIWRLRGLDNLSKEPPNI